MNISMFSSEECLGNDEAFTFQASCIPLLLDMKYIYISRLFTLFFEIVNISD